MSAYEPWRMHWIGRITSKKNRPRLSVRNGKPVYRQSKRTQQQEQELRWLATTNKPDTAMCPPLALRVVAEFRPPASGYYKDAAIGEHIGADPGHRLGGIPDGNGVLALVADALQGVIYDDDGALGIELIERRWSKIDQVTIEVGEIYERGPE